MRFHFFVIKEFKRTYASGSNHKQHTVFINVAAYVVPVIEPCQNINVRIPAKSTSDSNRKAPPIPGENIQ